MRVARLSVGREALDGGIRQAGRREPVAHHLRGGGEARGTVHAVEAAEVAHGPQRGEAVDLGMDRVRHLFGPERHRPILGGAGSGRHRADRQHQEHGRSLSRVESPG